MNAAKSTSTTRGRSDLRSLAVILGILGILAIIAGILYVSGSANSLHFLVGHVHKGHHQVRAIVAFVVGIALLIGAWLAARRSSTPLRSSRGSAQ